MMNSLLCQQNILTIITTEIHFHFRLLLYVREAFSLDYRRETLLPQGFSSAGVAVYTSLHKSNLS